MVDFNKAMIRNKYKDSDVPRGHNVDDFMNPNARFFYVTYHYGMNTGNSFGYGSFTSVTTNGGYPNELKAKRDIGANDKTIIIMNMIEMTRDEFVNYLRDYTVDDSKTEKQTYLFPAKFTQSFDGTINVSFRDVPGAITCAGNMIDAIDMAHDALAILFYDEEDIPRPSKPEHGEVCIMYTEGDEYAR